MRIGLIQIDTTEKKEVLRKIEDIVKNHKANIFVMPELLTTGYKDVRSQSENIDGETISFFSELSKERNSSFVFSFARKDKNKIYNTAVFVDGKTIFHYDKVHLFKPLGETDLFVPGRSLRVFDYKIGDIKFRFSMQVCYDLRFPESFRKLALNGVDIIFVPAQWPYVRINVWKSMLISRASENGIFIVGVNRVGEENGTLYGGHSAVISPSGEVLLELGKRESLAFVDIDLREIEETRKNINVLADIVPV